MGHQSSADKELDDMTECSICTEVFTDPRVLPCIHTFCLKCLLNYGEDGQPGDRMPCPLCRKEFTVPDNGLSGIQKNFFMEKLFHVRTLLTGQEEGELEQISSSNRGKKDAFVSCSLLLLHVMCIIATFPHLHPSALVKVTF